MIVLVASPTPRNPTSITKENALPVMAKGEVPKPYLARPLGAVKHIGATTL